MIRIDSRVIAWARDSWGRKHLKAAGKLALRQKEGFGAVYKLGENELFACYRKDGVAWVEKFPLLNPISVNDR